MQKYQCFEWGSTLNLDGLKIIIFQYIICEPFRSWKEGLVKLDVNLWEIWRKFKCRRSASASHPGKHYLKSHTLSVQHTFWLILLHRECRHFSGLTPCRKLAVNSPQDECAFSMHQSILTSSHFVCKRAFSWFKRFSFDQELIFKGLPGTKWLVAPASLPAILRK